MCVWDKNVNPSQACNHIVGRPNAFLDRLHECIVLNGNPNKYKVYAANRTSEDHRNSKIANWHHVRGELNPADIPSRKLTVDELIDSMCFQGPFFLREEVIEYKLVKPEKTAEVEEELKSTYRSYMDSKSSHFGMNLEGIAKDLSSGQLFDGWGKLLRSISMLMKFCKLKFKVKWPKTLDHV